MDTAHPHVALVLRLTEAFASRDRATIEALIADDCIWRVPGDNQIAGEYVGRSAIFGLFGRLRRLFEGPMTFDIVDIAVGRRGAAVHQFAGGILGGKTVRMEECLVYTIADGQVVEMDEYQFDLPALDSAFSGQ